MNSTHRIFFALSFHAFRPEIDEYMRKVKPFFPSAKWVNPEHYHLTLHFFAAVSDSQIQDARMCARKILTCFPKLSLGLKGSGMFPEGKRPKVFWLGLQGDLGLLEDCQRKLGESFRAASLPLEDRPFKPHLTVARFKDERLIILPKLPDFESSCHEMNEIILFESRLTSSGPHYETIETFPFSAV